MADNQFTVDLGTVKLTDAQRQSMSNAIQAAVASEIAKMGNTTNKIALIPINQFTKGPIIDGIYARDITRNFEQIIAGK